MKIFYDCEFVDDGNTIDLISIGMVREDGAELYRIVGDGEVMQRAVEHPWLRENVIPYLPVNVYKAENDVIKAWGDNPWIFQWDNLHADYINCVRPTRQIAEDVRRFIQGAPQPQLWAWYGAYDHIALVHLFGTMQDLPSGIPMFTNDLKQEHVRIGSPVLPRQDDGEHNALADARHNQVISRFMDKRILEMAHL